MRVLVVGPAGGSHVAQSLVRAAPGAGVEARLLDAGAAWTAPRPLRALHWRLGRRPARRRAFGRALLEAMDAHQPEVVLSAGLLPVERPVVVELGRRGARRVVFLTDDPWNPALSSASWRRQLPLYDRVFTPRTANLEQLRSLGCPDVRWLPFGYDPVLFHPPDPPVEKTVDVVFAGGADRDRVPRLTAIAEAGYSLALHGGYWDRYAALRALHRGHAAPEELARVLAGGRVALGLVRRANRDGHAMRSLEVPAVGVCMLAEDTAEHRTLLGEDGEAVAYFQDERSMLQRLEALLADPAERERLGAAARERVSQGGHTYRHRLETMLA